MRLTDHVSAMVVVTAAALATRMSGAQEVFASPADAASALVAAVQTGNRAHFLSITGQGIDRLLGTGDPERDATERESFLEKARTIRLEKMEDADAVLLYPGKAVEPFPAPLVKTGSSWRFDGEIGLRYATSRRIRWNEAAAIELCHRYFDAQTEYSTSHHGGGRRTFARRIRSTPGKHDGLYWRMEDGVDESPLGPLFAAAAFAEQQTGVQPLPYFGYYFKVLAAEGSESRGFALVAWPANYGDSGVRSFLVSELGQVYQKDLGVGSARAAGSMTAFQWDGGWSSSKTAKTDSSHHN